MKTVSKILLIILAAFYLPANALPGRGVINAEYFWDTDPGAGNATAISTSSSTFGTEVTAIVQNGITLPGIAGIHTFNIRVKDAAGNWGPLFTTSFDLDSAINSPSRYVNLGEYFWDTDPGQGSGTPMVAYNGSYTTAYQVITANAPVPIQGAHKLSIRSQDATGNWGPVFSTVVDVEAPVTSLREDSLVNAEYFWDADPGQGSGNPMLLSRGGSFTAAVQSLYKVGITAPAVGAHMLSLRSKDIAGNWGPVFSVVVDIETPITSLREDSLVLAEYFWDTDPGQGNGSAMLLSRGGSYAAAVQALSQTGVSVPAVGAHLLSLRSKDVTGNWGPVFSVVLDVETPIMSLREDSLIQAEYFWDTDPGQGSGNAMLLTRGGSFTAAFQALYQSGVSVPAVGAHELSLRSKDVAGNWGPVFGVVVDIETPITSLREDSLVLAEYFWDADPGQGNGNAMILSHGGSYMSAVEALYKAGITLPNVGAHELSIRSRDVAGNWGPVFSVVVDIETPLTSLREDSLILAEYFWDADPGQGLGNAMVLTRGGSYTAAVQAISKTGIAVPAVGAHLLSIRSKDVAGNWGPVFSVIADIEAPVTSLRKDSVIAAEYFFDVDPGHGNGTPLILGAGSPTTRTGDIRELLGGNLSAVTAGVHALYIRSRDVAGNWGPVFGSVVDIDTTIALNAHIVGPVSLCANELSGLYYTSADSGVTYAWTITGGTINSGSATDSVQVTWNNSGPYQLILSVCKGTNCVSDTDVITILPVSMGSASQTICQGQTYGGHDSTGIYTDTLTASNGCDSIVTLALTVLPVYNLIIPQTICQGQSFDGHNATGTYRDTLISSNGCDSIITIQLTVLPVPVTTINQVICQGQLFDGHTVAGVYNDTLTGSNGCDSIVSLNLTVTPASDTTISQTICQGQTFMGYGSTGTYKDTLTASSGCDSIVNLNLVVLPVSNSTISQIICQGVSYDGHDSTGTYVDTFSNVNGCDSIRILHLNVLPVTIINFAQTICQGQSFQGHASSGSYADTLTGSNGCDSIRILNLTVIPVINTSINTSICLGQNYDGHTATGTYVDTFPSVQGCDSIRTLNLTVSASINTAISQTICQGQLYDNHSTTGVYTDTFVANGGCDSIRVLTLTVLSPVLSSVTQSICQGQSYGGHDTMGTFVDTLTGSNGCDSIRTLHLTVLTVANTSITQSICQGQSYNGHTTSGTFIDTLTGSNGCDSIRTLHLAVIQPLTTLVIKTICSGQSFDGHDTSGTFIDTLTSAEGCDSIVTLNLTVQTEITTNVTESICLGQSYDGHTTSGVFVDTFTAAGGCDSIRTLNLIVWPVFTTSDSQSICQGQSYQGHDTSGTYVDSLSSVHGCDSIQILVLRVIPVTTTNVNHSICEGDTFEGHATSGNYVDTLIAGSGCDSLVTLHLVVNALPGEPTITQHGDSLVASAASGHLQWYRDSVLLAGDTNKLLVVNQNGHYTVEITDSAGCSGNSPVLNVTNVSVNDINGQTAVQVFPNPAADLLNIQMEGITPGSTLGIKMMDAIGQTVMEQTITNAPENYSTRLSMSKFAQGMYLLQLEFNNQTVLKKIAVARP